MSRRPTPPSCRFRRFELLARVSHVINSTLEPEKVLDLVLGEAVRLTQIKEKLLAALELMGR